MEVATNSAPFLREIILVTGLLIEIFYICVLRAPTPQRAFLTFALHALAKEALEQTLAVLADGGPRVGVHVEGVWHLHPPQDHLIHPDGPATPGRDALASLQQRALLRGST